MITLNDYLFSGHTLLPIMREDSSALRESARKTNNLIDEVHANFLDQFTELLENNQYLTEESMRLREFYTYLTEKYPYLDFTFKGRIKSLIRAEEKFNGYVAAYIYKYYSKYGFYPDMYELTQELTCFRDMIAYRLVISLPECYAKPDKPLKEQELDILYEIANMVPMFMLQRGFSMEPSSMEYVNESPHLLPEYYGFYRDYICNETAQGYKSLHLTLFNTKASRFFELQLRTKEMDDEAEIGICNHSHYEKRQNMERAKREAIPYGECRYFDEAYERGMLLQNLDLSTIKVNMFSAIDNTIMNDSIGLYKGRWILPYEHLAR